MCVWEMCANRTVEWGNKRYAIRWDRNDVNVFVAFIASRFSDKIRSRDS